MSVLRRIAAHHVFKCLKGGRRIQERQFNLDFVSIHKKSSQIEYNKHVSLSTLTSPDLNSTPQLKQVQNGLEIYFPKEEKLKSRSVFVDYLWLFDHCHCPKCYRENVNQKEGDPRQLGNDIKPENVSINDTELKITWAEGHQYTYQLAWILENIYEGYPRKSKYMKKSWTGALDPQEFPRHSFSNNLNAKQFAIEALHSLLVYGFCLIDGVPPTLEGTEQVARMICPLQRGIWGEGGFTIETTEDYIDTAYLDVYLPPHNDGTHLTETPGLQVIHIVKQSEIGGETYILDGCKAVEILKERDPFAFDYLSKTPVESSYRSDQKGFFYSHCETILRLHPYTRELLQMRFNFTDITPIKIIPQSEIRHFYRSYASLANILYDQSNHIIFKLHPGTMLLFDNWRLVHGRNSFKGERKLVGCFMSHSEFLSRARTLGVL